MTNDDPYEVAKVATARANQAEWRASAIRAVRRGFVHLRKSYDGNEEMMDNIGAMESQFLTLFKNRLEKLDEIAAVERAKAQNAMDLWNNREIEGNHV